MKPYLVMGNDAFEDTREVLEEYAKPPYLAVGECKMELDGIVDVIFLHTKKNNMVNTGAILKETYLSYEGIGLNQVLNDPHLRYIALIKDELILCSNKAVADKLEVLE